MNPNRKDISIMTRRLIAWENTPRYPKMTRKEIRGFLGHCPPECRVRISRAGGVTRYGSPDPTDRSKDFWQNHGSVEDYLEGRGNT